MERENSIMNQPKIIAYMKPSCGWSNGVRAVLKKYDLAYEDRDVINDAANYQEMVEKSGQPLQPTLDIDGKIVADVSGDRGMRAALGLPDDEQTIQELEALADEHAKVYEPVILHPPQATGLHMRLDHRGHGSTR